VGRVTPFALKTRLVDMALADGLCVRLKRVIIEQRERDRLCEHGFAPMRKPVADPRDALRTPARGKPDYRASSIRPGCGSYSHTVCGWS
jgi:hypothetical protein